jgi:hypothetical protein
MSLVSEVPSKKPYQKPKLKVYGNVEVLTGTVNNMGQLDGGGGGANRTH